MNRRARPSATALLQPASAQRHRLGQGALPAQAPASAGPKSARATQRLQTEGVSAAWCSTAGDTGGRCAQGPLGGISRTKSLRLRPERKPEPTSRHEVTPGTCLWDDTHAAWLRGDTRLVPGAGPRGRTNALRGAEQGTGARGPPATLGTRRSLSRSLSARTSSRAQQCAPAPGCRPAAVGGTGLVRAQQEGIPACPAAPRSAGRA